jgi:hypothetical protein
LEDNNFPFSVFLDFPLQITLFPRNRRFLERAAVVFFNRLFCLLCGVNSLKVVSSFLSISAGIFYVDEEYRG